MPIPAAELAGLQAAEEADTMPHRATWMRYSETNNGKGGRTEGWLATNDPGTNQPTIPIGMPEVAPAELFGQPGQQLAQAGAPYRMKVPVRVPLGVRDRLVFAAAPLGDGHTYEVVDVDDHITFQITVRAGCRRLV
jgi:hypothetical protein